MFYYPVDKNIKLKLLEKHHGTDLYYLVDKDKIFLQDWVDCIKNFKSVSDCEKFIIKALNKFAQGFEVHMGIWDNNTLVGCICIINIDCEAKKAEVGYYLGKEFQGNGYVTKSLKAVIDYLFEERKIVRIEANISEENLKSSKLAEKLGFKLEGLKQKGELINNRYHNILMYGLLKD